MTHAHKTSGTEETPSTCCVGHTVMLCRTPCNQSAAATDHCSACCSGMCADGGDGDFAGWWCRWSWSWCSVELSGDTCYPAATYASGPQPSTGPGSHLPPPLPLIVTMMLRGHCTAPPAHGVAVLQWHMLLIDHTQHKSISSEG